MYCPSCGKEFEGSSSNYCSACGFKSGGEGINSMKMFSGFTQFAGFWRRVGAATIDGIALWIVGTILFFLFFSSDMVVFSSYNKNTHNALVGLTMIKATLLNVVISYLYHAIMESSSKQATLGKLALGIKVTDMHGNRISFLRATGRYWGKAISGLILYIGFLMAGFTEKKQALHDMMASCLVVKN